MTDTHSHTTRQAMKTYTPNEMREFAQSRSTNPFWNDGAVAALMYAANVLEAADIAVRAERKRADALLPQGKRQPLTAGDAKDAERGRFMIKNGCWLRGEEQTHLAVLVPQGLGLSCYVTREAAIDAAIASQKAAHGITATPQGKL